MLDVLNLILAGIVAGGLALIAAHDIWTSRHGH